MPHKRTLLKYTGFGNMSIGYNSDVIEKFTDDIKLNTILEHEDDDDDKLFLWYGWPTKSGRLILFPVGTIVRDPHHRKSLTCRNQDLNLRRT